jgi:nitrogen fixation protein FixH
VPDSLGIMVPFLVITAVNLVMAILLLKNVDDDVVRKSA